MPKPNRRRLPCENYELTLGVNDTGSAGHKFTVSLAYDGVGGPLREVAFVGRGRIGGGIDLMFHELGIKLSRAIQGRDPETGIDIAASKG